MVLVMTGVITLRMITKAFGNLPGEEQQEKAGHTAQWAEEPWQQTFLGAGLCNGEHSISQWLFFPYLRQSCEKTFLGTVPRNLLGFLEFNLFYKCGLFPQT